MPKCLNLAVAAAGACLIVGCATQSKSNLGGARRMPNALLPTHTVKEADAITQLALIFPAAT